MKFYGSKVDMKGVRVTEPPEDECEGCCDGENTSAVFFTFHTCPFIPENIVIIP